MFFGRYIAGFFGLGPKEGARKKELRMKNSAKILLCEARHFRDSGDFLAAKLLVREALERGGENEALTLLDRLNERVRALYLPEELAESKNYVEEMQTGSGAFSILRNTEVNLEGAFRYTCHMPDGHIYLGRAGLRFCPYAPFLPCDSKSLPHALTALRLAGERTRAGLLLNKNSLCGACPKLKKLPVAEADKRGEVLEIHISALKPETYTLAAGLNFLAERGLLASGCRYILEELLAGDVDAPELKEIIAVMLRFGGRGLFRVAPDAKFSSEIFDALAAQRAELICELDEHSDVKAWEKVQRYCACGHPESVSIGFTFQEGSLPPQSLQDFLSHCLAAGCRKLVVAFNERLEADERLLANKDFLEKSAFVFDLDLHIDQESLDAVIFNRKATLRRAQADWTPGAALLATAGRTLRARRAASDTLAVARAVGQN